MIKKEIIFFGVLIFLINCNSYKKKNKCNTCKIETNTTNITNVKGKKLINFKHIKEFAINYKSSKKNFFYVQPYIDNKKLYIIFNSSAEKKLVYIDIEKKTSNEFITPEKNAGFFRHNKDSLFFLFNPHLRKGGNHDSTLVLMNETGKISKFYDYSDAHVINSKNLPDLDKQISDFFSKNTITNNEPNDSLMYMATDPVHPLVYEKDKLFLTFIRNTGCPYCLGGKDFFKVELPFVGYVDLQKNKFIGFDKLKYPYLNDNTYYPSGYQQIHLISLQNNKEILVSFEYTSLLYKYNFLTDSLIKIKGFKSIFKDSIQAFSEKPKTAIKIQRYSYNHIFFDKKNKRYIRNFNFPYNKHLSSLIFADSSFNTFAEGILPKGFGFITSISKDTLLFYNFKKSIKSPDSIYFSLFTIDEKPGITQKIYSELKNTDNKKYDIKDYINNITKTKEKNYAVVIIPVDLSCPGCVKITLKFFSDNIKKISEIPLYLIIPTVNEKLTKERLHNYNLDNKPGTVFIDETITYFNYHASDEGINPRLILIENNKITSDKIYDAKKIRKLQDTLINFLLKYKYIDGYYNKKNKPD